MLPKRHCKDCILALDRFDNRLFVFFCGTRRKFVNPQDINRDNSGKKYTVYDDGHYPKGQILLWVKKEGRKRTLYLLLYTYGNRNPQRTSIKYQN
jgi:hypothetical protein